jgi:hypothetical protein
MSLKKTAVGAAVLVCVVMAYAGASQILFPQMEPEKGSFEKPAGTLGQKPKTDAPWSTTTVAAAVDGKPLPGKVVTVVGEILDLSCYLSLGKHGTKHRDCGQKCLKNGAPIGLLTKDGQVYTLIEEEHDPRRDGLTNFREAAIENMANIMEVSGVLSKVGGQQALFVRGYVKKN